MAMTPVPVFAQTQLFKATNMTAIGACSTRAPTATGSLAGANIIALTAASTNGLRVDSIQIQGNSAIIGTSPANGLVGIWMWDSAAATAYLIDEIAVASVAPSTTVATAVTIKYYTNPLLIPATNILYCSSTIATQPITVLAAGGVY